MDSLDDPKRVVILKCLGIIAEDILDLPNCPTKQKIDFIVSELDEVIRQLLDMKD